MTENCSPSLRLCTIYNQQETEWVTVIENGIPRWVAVSDKKKQELLDKISSLLKEASSLLDDEPIISIVTDSHTYVLNYFEMAGLYLCDDLEGRYASLSSIIDALWELLENQKILQITLDI
jgi:hypothetical protein